MSMTLPRQPSNGATGCMRDQTASPSTPVHSACQEPCKPACPLQAEPSTCTSGPKEGRGCQDLHPQADSVNQSESMWLPCPESGSQGSQEVLSRRGLRTSRAAGWWQAQDSIRNLYRGGGEWKLLNLSDVTCPQALEPRDKRRQAVS